MEKLNKTITLGELRHKLIALLDNPDDTIITFGQADLSFYDFKNWQYRADNQTPAIINLEFNELYKVTADPHDSTTKA